MVIGKCDIGQRNVTKGNKKCRENGICKEMTSEIFFKFTSFSQFFFLNFKMLELNCSQDMDALVLQFCRD